MEGGRVKRRRLGCGGKGQRKVVRQRRGSDIESPTATNLQGFVQDGNWFEILSGKVDSHLPQSNVQGL